MIGARDTESRKVMRFSAAVAATLLGGFWLSGWQCVSRVPTRVKMATSPPDGDVPPMQTIVSRAEVEDAVRHPRVVLFVDVDWSIQSRQARQLIYPLVRSFHQLAGPSDVRFFRIDATEQGGEAFEWLCSSGLKNIAYWGYGSLVFISEGKVFDRVESPSQQTADDLWQHIERFAS